MKQIILCVDDEKTILDSLKQELRNAFGEEFIYEEAENAEDALEIARGCTEEKTSLAVVISDWLMPGIKGDEFLVRLHKTHPDAVKILITGQADQSSVERVKKEANLFAKLDKPWDPVKLMECIKSGISLHS
ncbi:MAG TPA: response regulator [Leptospiraceae bacterium]|nr:response regulator [Leptospiraceae bacterium]HNF16350.1 response regulator [Leptospiraceae bacterium]HNF23812.1 response regulator [Leptospiraceae bacterium]HNI26248.1 response regulator [Leptospiraceae bacterium]HNM05378.1 response regulator [Leptospiraceae bacterium]